MTAGARVCAEDSVKLVAVGRTVITVALGAGLVTEDPDSAGADAAAGSFDALSDFAAFSALTLS